MSGSASRAGGRRRRRDRDRCQGREFRTFATTAVAVGPFGHPAPNAIE